MIRQRLCLPFAVAATFLLLSADTSARAQAPTMAQVPFVSAAAGNATGSLVAPCSSSTDLSTSGGADNGDGCAATQAVLGTPYGTAVDSMGNVYFADSANEYVRVIYRGGAHAAAMIAAANANHPGLTLVSGDIYALAGGLGGSITTTNADGQLACGNVAGNPDAGDSSGDNCPAAEGYINTPYGAAVDADGNVFIADRGGSKVHVVYAGGSAAAALITLENPNITAPQIGYMYLIAGGSSGYADGALATGGAKIHQPGGLAVDSNENVYIADTANNAIREIVASTGFMHTIGGASCTTSGCGKLATAPANNVAATTAEFIAPQSLGVDASGNVYVADDSSTQGNNSSVYPSVRVIYAGGSSNIGAGLICLENGSAGYGKLTGSCSAATLIAGNVYTIAGTQTNVSGSSGNGSFGAAVQFEKLTSLAVDRLGNVYVADYSSPSVVVEIDAQTGYAVFLQSDGQATSGEVTAGSYCAPGLTSGPQADDAYGDGCPGPQSYAHHIEGNMAVDAEGSVYYADAADELVRKLSFGRTFASNTIGSSATQSFAFTLLPVTTSSNLVLGTPSVVTEGNANAAFTDAGTGDTCTNGATLYGSASATTTPEQNTTCVLNVTFTPTKIGATPGAITINGPSSPAVTTTIGGIGAGADLVIDPSSASSTLIGNGTTPQGVATDLAGNTYVAFAGSGTVTSTGGALSSTAGTGLSAPYQIAVDGLGNVFVADSGNDRIAEFAAGSSTAVTAVSGLSGPKGVAVDSESNLYIADSGSARVLLRAYNSGEVIQLGNGFDTPVAVAVDASGSIYVADPGLGSVVRIDGVTGVQTTLVSSADPVGIAVDAAGDVDYLDGSSMQVVEIPVSGSNTTLATGFKSPAGIALDVSGGLYVADSANTGVSYFARTDSTQTFPDISTQLSATLTNVGNQNFVATNGTFTQTDSIDFDIAASSSNGCNFADPLAAGTACNLTAQFTPTQNGTLSDTSTFAGNALDGPVTLNVSGTGSVTVATTTALGGITPSAPVYGQSVQITATVSANSGSSTPTGNVTFTVDGIAQAPVALNGGAYTLTLSSLSAGQHTVSASYAGGGDFSGSTAASPASFTIAPLAITASANNVTATYGQSVPAITGSLTGVLGADAGSVTAVFSTTATSSSPAGSYPITVALAGSAASNYTVTLNGTPTVTISPATVTLVVNSATKVYGAANPAFSGTLSGVLPSDQANVSPVFSTTATASSPVANYPIGASGLSGSAACNYTLGTVTPGTLTVTPLAITATATPATMAYGAPVPALTGTLTGVLPADTGNVTPIFSTTATSTSPVGVYPIGVSLAGSAAANYTVTLSAPAAVTVTPAAVTVVVSNATRMYGAANPTFTGTLTAVLAQDAANVSAVYSTSAAASSGPGNYSITATGLIGSAAANYKLGAVTPGTLSVTQATTTTVLTSSTASTNEESSITFTAAVTSATGAMPTGSVTFYNGTSSIGTAQLTNGVATVMYSQLPFGAASITATYTGSADFSASTSSPLSENIGVPVVNGSVSSSTLTVSAGGSATTTLTLTDSGGYTGTATYSCFNLPADMTCMFSPATSTFTSSTLTTTTQLTVSTSSSASSSEQTAALGPARTPLLAICVPAALFAFVGFRRRKLSSVWHRRFAILLLLAAGIGGFAGITGCGSGSGPHSTPPGSYNIEIAITAGTVQTVPLTVVVK